jgi:uncharacterized protein (TIGR03435 family)
LIAAAVSIPLGISHIILTAQTLTFEVASVKANTSGERRSSLQMNLPDAFTATNLPLMSMISLFYEVPAFKMSGGPGWLMTDRFDINAKADRRITMDEKRAMLRALLEDRFKLKVHRETKEGRTYALVRARKDGALGPNLKPSALDCAAIVAERERTGARPVPNAANPIPDCVALTGPFVYNGRGIQIGGFANSLGAMMRETVVDETGLTGWWDLKVEGNLTGAGDPPGGRSGAAPERPSVFTAVQEQLGLKLEPRRGPVEFFVIDSAERPTSD